MSEADLMAGVHDIRWSELHHAYGPATDVPGLLHDVAEADDSARDQAITELFGTICHQGTVYEATGPAVPFVARLARDAEMTSEHRALLVGLLAYVAAGDDGEARDAVAAEFPALVTRLVGLDPWIDRYLALVASQVPGAAGTATGLLDRLVTQNRDPQILAALTLTMALISRAPASEAADVAANLVLDEWDRSELEDRRASDPERWPNAVAARLFEEGFGQDPLT